MKTTPLFYKIIGWLGTFCIMSAYAFNSFGVIPSEGFIYAGFNLAGAIMLGIRVYLDRNWANVFLEVFFGVVALISIARLLI